MRGASPLRRPAAGYGPPLLLVPGTPQTVAANLAARVAERPDGIIRSYDLEGAGRFQSYANTWHRSGSILAGLREFGIKPGEIVVLLIEDVIDFVPAYWACIRGGFVAAPLMSAARERSHQRSDNPLREALDRLSNVTVVTDESFVAIAANAGREEGLRVLPLRIAEACGGRDDDDAPPADPLCLVPSSGSTGRLKLVALSHSSVLYRSFVDPFQKQASFLGTLALDSITAAQNGIFLSHGSWTQMSPVAFTARPTSVLDAIECHCITAVGCTTSAVKTILAAAQRAGRKWNLGSLYQFGVGAEPVVLNVIQRLGDLLDESGSSREIITAGYGTTEAGFLVTGAHPLVGPNHHDEAVRLGTCAPGVELRIVGDDDEVLAEGEIGEVQVTCPQRIFSSYWGEPDATRKCFTADGWWRTGDLGRLQHGELSLHGRAKDVLVVSGKKFALAEIDAEIETVLSVGDRAFCCAVHWPEEALERLAVVVVAAEDITSYYELIEKIRAAVGRRFGLRADPVMGASLDDVPFAANGKLRRSELADRICRGLLTPARQSAQTLPALQSMKAETALDIEEGLARIWREVLDLHGDFDRQANFFDLGGDSLRSLMLYTCIEAQFGQQISADEFFASPTFADLLRLVLRGCARSALSPAPPSQHFTPAAELETAYLSGKAPAFDHASSNQWAVACHELWEAGRIDRVEFAARSLHLRFPELDYVRTLVAYFDALPGHLPAALAFSDDPAAEIQIVRRPDRNNVILCFCAANGTLGLPLNFVHQWLGRLPSSLVYIKDFRNLRGGCGFPTLGPDRGSAIAAFRRIADDIGAKRIYTLGVSLGGYAALYYGLKLEAVAVLNLAGATDYTPNFVRTLGPVLDEYLAFCERAPDYAGNLRDLLVTARHKPRVLMAYSAGQSHDRQQAERIAGLPEVELLAVDYAQHNVVDPLVREKKFLPLLERFLSEEF